MGPLHQPAQKAFVAELVEEAKAAGADGPASSASCPAASSPSGNFLRPALVVDPDPSLRVVTQEQFGPVIPVIPFDDEDGGGAAGQRHLGRPVRLGLDRGPRHGQPDRRPAASAATSGSTTTAPPGWTCAPPSAA